MLRHHWLAWTALIAVAPVAFAQQKQPKAQPPALAPEVKARALEMCLANWEKAMKGMENFVADVDRVEQDRVYGSQDSFSGPVKYLKPNKVLMDLKKANKPEIYDKWLCTGTFIYQYVPQAKKVNVIEVPQSKNSGEDSVISMLGCLRSEEARKRYDLSYVMEDQHYHYIEIRPKTAEDKNDFTWARLVLRKENFLPREVRFLTPANTEVLWNIRSLQINAQGVDAKDFAPDMPQGWKVEKVPTARSVRQ